MLFLNIWPTISSYIWGLIMIFDFWQSGVMKSVILFIIFFAWKNTNWQDYHFQMEISPPLFCQEEPHTGGWCSVLGNLYLGFLVLVLPCLADIWTGGGHIGTHLRTPVLFHLRVNVYPWTLLTPNRWPVEVCSRYINSSRKFIDTRPRVNYAEVCDSPSNITSY